MKLLKKLAFGFVISLVCMLMVFSTANAAQVTAKLQKTKITLTAGETYILKLYNKNKNKKAISNKKIKWKSEDKSIAKINSSGKITAVASGSVKVSAKYGGKTYKCTVKVKKAKFDYSKKTITSGDSFSQKLRDAKGKAISNSKIKWSTANTSIATVTSKGKINAKKPGTVKISAKYAGKTYKFTVKVKKATFDYSGKVLYIGDTFNQTLKTSTGKYISTSKIKWSTENRNIAVVNSNGTVQAKSVGKTKVYATFNGVKYSYIVNVNPMPLSSLHIIDSKHYECKKGAVTDSFGNTYSEAHTLKNLYESRNNREPHATFNLNGKYKTFKGSVVALDKTNPDHTYYVNIFVDGILVFSNTEYTKTTGKIDFNINVTDSQVVSICAGLAKGLGDTNQMVAVVNANFVN